MAKYIYRFVGDKNSKEKYTENVIEIPDEWETILRDLDKAEQSNNRSETRRHYSLDNLLDKGFKIRDYTQDLDFVLDWNEHYNDERRLEKLQRQVFHKFLTDKQADIYYRHRINAIKVGRAYKIAKQNVIDYVLNRTMH